MIDFRQWVYARDMADWLSLRPTFDIREQADCILSAPHKNLTEKLKGLQTLWEETDDREYLKEYLELGEYLEQQISRDKRMLHELYTLDLFYHGQREMFEEKRIFRAPQEGIRFMRQRISEKAEQCETNPEEYFGVLYGFWDRNTKMLERQWSFVLNDKGETLYALPEGPGYRGGARPVFGAHDDHYSKLPYGSGTLVEMTENPFFPSMKGILVNEEAEPWEEGFDLADQWLLYPDFLHGGSTVGIGIIKLDDYASITFGADILLPFRQFLRGFEGTLSKEETWLLELGELVRKNKAWVSWIMRDSQPKRSPSVYEKCENYVRELVRRAEGGDFPYRETSRHG